MCGEAIEVSHATFAVSRRNLDLIVQCRVCHNGIVTRGGIDLNLWVLDHLHEPESAQTVAPATSEET